MGLTMSGSFLIYLRLGIWACKHSCGRFIHRRFFTVSYSATKLPNFPDETELNIAILFSEPPSYHCSKCGFSGRIVSWFVACNTHGEAKYKMFTVRSVTCLYSLCIPFGYWRDIWKWQKRVQRFFFRWGIGIPLYHFSHIGWLQTSVVSKIQAKDSSTTNGSTFICSILRGSINRTDNSVTVLMASCALETTARETRES
jgi:hypothetical protein